ncbi:tripartite tricarboxylate transporter permease [bacterium]|nr:tripartite tricarboxylate transporter permease [bacterium]
MDQLSNLLMGFSVLLDPINLVYCFVGCLVGTLVGVLPGIGPVGAIAILLPATFGLDPVTGIIMLAGIYYGGSYGGSTTSILVNIPGEACSVVTCLDGYQMAKKGRAGPALGIAAMGSFIGGNFSVICLMLLVYPLAEIAIKFGPPEFFAVMVMGLSLVTYLARGALLRTAIVVVAGLILGCVGVDHISGTYRFLFGIPELADGVPLVPVVMGLFGIGEVLSNLERPGEMTIYETGLKSLFPTLDDWKKSIGPIIRGSFLGFVLGIIPGGGTILSSFTDYSMEKKISKNPEEFGRGAIEGVAGPETANNAAVAGCFVPLMVFGIPSNIVMALFLGALLIHGITPGPVFIQQHPEIFWGTIASMYMGNGMLLILNLPLIPFWVRLLKVPYRILFPLILLFCVIGVYSTNNSVFDIYVMIFFGVVGYFLKKLQYEFAPWVLAFVLGPMLETNFRQALIMLDGNLLGFLYRPISAVCIIISILLLGTGGLSFIRNTRQKLAEFGEE